MEIPKSQATPPGRRLVKSLSLRSKSIFLTVSGFILLGVGLIAFQHSSYLYFSKETTAKWLLSGCYSFLIIGASILLITQGSRFRILIDTRREIRRAMKQKAKNSLNKKNRPMQKTRKKAKNPTKQD